MTIFVTSGRQRGTSSLPAEPKILRNLGLPPGMLLALAEGAMVERGARKEYWRHKPSDLLWAVEVLDGRVLSCVGPLDPRDVTGELLDYLPLNRKDAWWVEERRDEFVRQVAA